MPTSRYCTAVARPRFLRMSRGAAIIRYWGGNHAVAVPPEALSLPTLKGAAKRFAARDEPTARERLS
jgi:hypothetical protein